ncbi:MAG: hypothetical protein ACN2B6_12700 [Rickettsiales bacterium]
MSKRLIVGLMSTLLFSGVAMARDDKLMMSIENAMGAPDAQAQLTGDIKFYFGKNSGPANAKKMGTFSANRKTNAFGKSDEEACNWVFLSAMIALRDRAMKEGGNAVVDIHSFYKSNPLYNSTEFECHAGNIMAGVALRGTVVKLP